MLTFTLLLAVCRGVDYVSWEHRFPKFVVLIIGPESGYELQSDFYKNGAHYIIKKSIRPYGKKNAQCKRTSFKLSFGQYTIHRIITIVEKPLGSLTHRQRVEFLLSGNTPDPIEYLLGDAALEQRLLAIVSKMERNERAQRRRENRGPIRRVRSEVPQYQGVEPHEGVELVELPVPRLFGVV
ncbi:hypothetical protein SLS58_008220 [Diplodia intermedia]|uniref:Uncharacterized protein n=1 Tax=Diplodia intermedia TaxID=856260 RepID=A0ABR3TI10_9PEZI